MPPKKAIAFGKIGSFGQLSISSNTQPATKSDDGGFGKFGKSDEEFLAEPTTDVEQAMGFQGFGKNKAAPVNHFDIESLVEQSKQVARERNIKKISDLANKIEEESAEDTVGPMPPPEATISIVKESVESEVSTAPKKSSKKTTRTESDDEDGDSSDSDDEGADTYIPAALEVNLNHGTKPVSALSVDHSGARLISGSVDYDIKLWDFAGMSSSLQSFRTVRPCER